MRKFVGALACVMCCEAASGQWLLQPPSRVTRSSTAVLSITPFDSRFETAAVTVEYPPNHGCAPAVGLMVVNRGGRGRALTTGPERGNDLLVEVSGRRWLIATYLIRYENGFEAIGPVLPQLVESLRAGSTVRVWYENQFAFEFSPVRDSRAIEWAERICRAS